MIRRLLAAFLVIVAAPALAAGPDEGKVRRVLAGLAMPFEENAGQHDGQVAYLARIAAGAAIVTRDGRLVHSLPGDDSTPGWTLVESFPGAKLEPRGVSAHATSVTYLGHPDAAPRHARTWGAVSLGEPWPGIDVSVVARGSDVEKLFTVSPGADASGIRVRVSGARTLRIDASGALVAETGSREVRFTPPAAWQEIAGERKSVEVAYRVGAGEYGFRLGAHDPRAAVVIDPVLQVVTLGGGTFNTAYAIRSEAAGTVLVAGAASYNFPGTAGGAQPTFVGGMNNGFVARLSADLATVVQATYFGGAVSSARALAVDGAGNVFIAGQEIPDRAVPPTWVLPGTAGAAQPSSGGGFSEAFVAKLAGDLRSVVRATYLGGNGNDFATALALDAEGSVLVAGETDSSNFPGAAGGAQGTPGGGRDAFVARLSNDLTTLVRATYFGGVQAEAAHAIAVDGSGNVYVAGETGSAALPGLAGAAQPGFGGSSDAFIARFTPDLATLVRASYFGGSGFDRGYAIAPGPAGVYVAGDTSSTSLPGTAGGARVSGGGHFVALLTPDLAGLVQSTYLEGAGSSGTPNALALSGTDLLVAGTTSTVIPSAAGGAQPFFTGSAAGYVSRVTVDLKSIVQSTYVSASSTTTSNADLKAIALEPSGSVLVAGRADIVVQVARIRGDLRGLPTTGFLVAVGPRVARGGTVTVTVTARDAENGTAAGYPGTVRLTTSDPEAVITPATRTLTRGVGTFTVTFNTAGSQTVTAVDEQDGALTGNASLAVSNVARIAVEPPASVTAGVGFSATVTAYDAADNALPGALLRFTSTAADAVMSPDVTTVAGPVTRPFQIRTAGPQTLTATDLRPPGVAGTSPSINVVAAAPQRLALSAPAQFSTGTAFSVVVEARDSFGNLNTTTPLTIRFTSSDPAAVLPADSPLSGGTGTFPVTFNTPGTHTLVATVVGQQGVTGSVLVVAAPAVRFEVAAPASATAGAAFDITVAARSPTGALLTGYSGAIRFSSSDASAVLPAPLALANGTGTFSVVLKTAGQRTLGVTDVANATYVGTSPGVMVNPAAAAALAITAPALALPGVSFNVVVSARDAFGNLVPTNASTVRLASSDPAALLPSDAPLVNGTRTYPVTMNTIGTQTVTAGDPALALASATSPGISVSTFGVAPTALDFGGQSMGTTSPPLELSVLATAPSTLTFALPGTQFAQTNDCASAPATTCTIRVTFSPAVAPGALNSTAAAAGTLTVSSPGAGSREVALAGTGEKSLVTHYYRSILRRAPDADGKAFWQNEAARVAGTGANLSETWFAMAQAFFLSPEYAAFNATNVAFATDLYRTFFDRAPDAGGLQYWTGQLTQGLPREVLLAAFMFSPEFRNVTTALFGDTAARAEVDVTMDFYRGLLGRLPDTGGLAFWVGRFRVAQCTGSQAVLNEVESISRSFALSGEYLQRSRNDSQYVGDLYNAFLRRGGDLPGVQYWINGLSEGLRTREFTRGSFKESLEFRARVNRILQQGCLQ